MSNYIQVGQAMCKKPVHFNWRPYTKYDCLWYDLRETLACPTALLKEPPYRMLWKSEKLFKCWH